MAEPTHANGPRLAVSAAIFRENRLLLVQRSQNPMTGVWTLPGGKVEFGERLEDAVQREVLEETGLTIRIVSLAGYRQILPGQSGNPLGHYVILPFAARWHSGEVTLNEELGDYRWVMPGELTGFKTTEGLSGIVRTAANLVRQS